MNIRLLLCFILLYAVRALAAVTSDPVYPLHLDKSYRQDYDLSVVRTPDGYLWIGSDNGLNRYDGYNLRQFKHDPNDPKSLGSPRGFKVFVDAGGTLWVLDFALSRYSPDTETFTRYLGNAKVFYAAADAPEGKLWLGGDQMGLQLFDPKLGEVSRRYFVDTHTPLTIFSILTDKGSDRVWLATSDGLRLFDPASGQSETYFQLPNTRGFLPYMGIAQDISGDIWIASREGLFRVNPTTRKVRQYPVDAHAAGAISTHALTAIASDSHNNIWIGSEKLGVFRHDPNTDTFEHYPASAYDQLRFSPTTIADIYEDPQGTVWFACGQGGVFSVNRPLQKFKSFRHSFDTDNSLGFNQVSYLFEDSKGFIWIGTDGNGVDRFDPNTFEFRHFRHDPTDPQTLGSNAVIAINEDSQGYIWLGTWAGGLNRLDPNSGKVRRYLRDPNSKDGKTPAENHVMRIYVDPQDRLLLGGVNSGLQIFDPSREQFQAFKPDEKTQPKGIQNNFINDIIPAAESSFWLGGYKTLERFTPATGLSVVPDLNINKGVLDLHQDKNGLLWIATNAGLYRFNPSNNEVLSFTTADGMPDAFIVGIEQDSLGYLWLATRNGLVRLEQNSRTIDTFDELDGLASADFNRGSHLTTRAGLMFFGTNQGFSFFDPLQIPRNEYAPQVHLTELQINHRVQHIGTSPWLDRALDMTATLVLPSWADDIKITFAATNLVMPAKNRYRYRLLGRSADWIDASEQRSAEFSNLPPGHYTLQLIAANNDGVWTGTTRDLSITLLPAWWQTWWAYCLYAMLVLAAFQGFSMLRMHLSNQRRKKLEQLVNEQTGKLKDANRAISQLNIELEQRVAQRTSDLSAEVEERKESEAKVTYIAYHDILTGLYNRAWLLQHLDNLIKATNTTPEKHPFALLFIGGDRFRTINDIYGHQTGDNLLITVAEKLRQICPLPAQLTRLGGDEFVVLIDQLPQRSLAKQLADAIVEEFKHPIVQDRLRLTLSVSVGYVISSDRIVDAAQVLRDANIAMQKAKDRGRGMSQEFDGEMLQQKLEQTALEADLKLALSRGEFRVVLQPIMQLDGMQIAAFEILIRWHHPERGLVPPDRFIGMAESSGLIFDIGLWVLEQACLQVKAWKATWPDQAIPIIAVNLSPIQLEREDFLARIDDIFASTQVRPENFEFEITESALLRQTKTVNSTLNALRQRSIQLAIDDFGTGYSSLSYLGKLPVQVLKIDRSFVNALTENDQLNNNVSEIVRATITLAHTLKMAVVAEGVETAEQLKLLQTYGCDYGQGYFFARPLPAQDATAMLMQQFAQK